MSPNSDIAGIAIGDHGGRYIRDRYGHPPAARANGRAATEVRGLPQAGASRPAPSASPRSTTAAAC